MKCFINAAAFCLAFVMPLEAEVSFADGEFTITFSDFSVSQDVTGVSFSGVDTASLSGTFSSYFIGDASSITLTGSIATNPNSNFQVLLFDLDNDFLTFTGNWSDFGTSSTSVILNLQGETGTFNGSATRLSLLTSGSGVSIAGSLVSVSAIPEPAMWAVMLGGTALFMVVGRRQRRTAA